MDLSVLSSFLPIPRSIPSTFSIASRNWTGLRWYLRSSFSSYCFILAPSSVIITPFSFDSVDPYLILSATYFCFQSSLYIQEESSLIGQTLIPLLSNASFSKSFEFSQFWISSNNDLAESGWLLICDFVIDERISSLSVPLSISFSSTSSPEGFSCKVILIGWPSVCGHTPPSPDSGLLNKNCMKNTQRPQ